MAVLSSARPIEHSYVLGSTRSTPQVLQTLASIDGSTGSVGLSVELATRHGRTRSFDWLLRLDLARDPPVHEEWHGQAHGIGGQVNLEVQPMLWPRPGERWFLRLWLRDPSGSADWDLVETRALP